MKEHNKEYSLFISRAIIVVFSVFIFVWFLALFFFFGKFLLLKTRKVKKSAIKRKTK